MYEENIALIWLVAIMLFVAYAVTHDEQSDYDVVSTPTVQYLGTDADEEMIEFYH